MYILLEARSGRDSIRDRPDLLLHMSDVGDGFSGEGGGRQK